MTTLESSSYNEIRDDESEKKVKSSILLRGTEMIILKYKHKYKAENKNKNYMLVKYEPINDSFEIYDIIVEVKSLLKCQRHNTR